MAREAAGGGGGGRGGAGASRGPWRADARRPLADWCAATMHTNTLRRQDAGPFCRLAMRLAAVTFCCAPAISTPAPARPHHRK